MSAAWVEGCHSWDFSGIFLWVCVTFLSTLTSLVASGKQDFSHGDWGSKYTRSQKREPGSSLLGSSLFLWDHRLLGRQLLSREQSSGEVHGVSDRGLWARSHAWSWKQIPQLANTSDDAAPAGILTATSWETLSRVHPLSLSELWHSGLWESICCFQLLHRGSFVIQQLIQSLFCHFPNRPSSK